MAPVNSQFFKHLFGHRKNRYQHPLSHRWCFGTALILLSAAGGFAALPALAAVGAIGGSFSVTPTGQAAYTIPLPTPGGAGGLAPHLSLVYESGSGPGLLGWDATVGGLSIITRCPSTYTYDNSTAPVNLTSRDKFCLDGQEMTLKTGTYGDNGATYDTTPASHMEEVSHTTDNSTGPQWFTVLHPDGTVWEYGHQFNSEVTATNAAGDTVGRVWVLDQIEDRSHNVVTFHYTQPSGTGAYYLSEVDWGGNVTVGTSADHSLVFGYETVGADATVYRYVVGNEITWNQRLTGILLDYNGTPSLTWTPSYLPAGQGSNRSRLASMTECDANNNCLPATTFQWQQGTPGFAAAQNTGQAGAADAFVADVNGDGREDLIYDRGGVWRVRFGTASGGFGSEHSTGVSVSDAAYAQPIHYENGTADQILVDSGGDWMIIAWTGSGFTNIGTGIAVSGGVAAADINGDGYDDLVTYVNETGENSGAKLIAHLNTAASGSPGFGSAQTVYDLTPPAGYYHDTYYGFDLVGAQGARGPSRTLHFTRVNAGIVARWEQQHTICLEDGCPPGGRERIVTTNYTQAYAWDNGALVPYGNSITASLSGPDPAGLVALDANGDGLTDLALNNGASGLSLLLNTGSGFSAVAYGGSTSGLSLDASVAADYSGNGRDDLLVPDTTTGDWMLLASTGISLADPVDTGVASSAFGTRPVAIDSEGRMLDDLVGANASGDIELALRSGAYPDLVTEITDGLGNYHSPSWASLSDTTAVTASATVGYPFAITRRGPPVVASTEANDGAGGSYTMSYVYNSPARVVSGGFVGFQSIAATDGRDNHTTTTTWLMNPYRAHFLSDVTVTQPNGDKIQDQAFDYGTYYGVNAADSVMIANVVTTHYDAVGNELYYVQHHYTYNGNEEPSKVITWVFDWQNDKTWQTTETLTLQSSTTTSNWCLALPSEVDVQRWLPDNSSTTRKTSYTPDLAHCRESTVTTNSQDTNTSTTTTFTYGSFGNVTIAKVVGHNADGSAMAARTTYYYYDSRGEFETSMKDALGEVTSYGWNDALGFKTSETAPNGTATSYVPDGFGRLTKTTYPSGAYRSTARNSCSGTSCAHWAYELAKTLYTPGGAVAKQSRGYYDSFGRLYDVEKRLGEGTHPWSTIAYRYNALGELNQQSAPYFAGSGDPVYWTTTTFDTLGRVTRQVTPAPGGGTAGTGYSYSGLTTTITDPKGDVTVVTEDPLGQIKSILDAKGNTTDYTYTPFGQLAHVTGPGGTTSSVSYDSAGHRISLTAPDLGTVALAFQNDSLGEVTQKTNAAGEVTDYVYDNLGRMTNENFPGDTSENNRWIFAATGNAAGQLTQETKGNGYSRTLTYNALGEPITDKETYGGTPWTMHYTYDTLGRVASITYPTTAAAQALKLDYAYDGLGNLASVTDANSGTVYWQADGGASIPAVNAWGEAQAWTLGDGVDVQRAHDGGTGLVTSIVAGPSHNASRVSLGYGYDPLENTETTVDVLTGVTRTLTNDGLSRLTQSVIANSSGNHTYNFYYNGAGNITSRTGVGSYSYTGAEPHAVTKITEGGTTTNYAYDAAGRMSSGGPWSQIQWNQAGRAKQITGSQTTNLAYTTNGNLLQSTVGGTTSRYFGKLFVQVGSGWRERIVANGEVIALVDVNSTGYVTTDYLVHDNLGSPAAILDASGNLAARFAWDAWGDLVNPATGIGPDPNASTKEALTTIGYTGHEMLWKQGLVHTWSRYYDPATGRWIGPDCGVPHPYNGQSFNRYSYVLNNPLSLSDMLGLAGSDQTACSSANFNVPNDIKHQFISKEARSAAEAFLSIVERIRYSSDFSGYAAKSLILSEIAGGTMRITISEGINNAYKWQEVPGGYNALTLSGSWINWHNLQINWGTYGAEYGGNYKTAIRALCNLIKASLSKSATSDNSAQKNSDSTTGGGGGFISALDLAYAFFTVDYYTSSAYVVNSDGSHSPCVGGFCPNGY